LQNTATFSRNAIRHSKQKKLPLTTKDSLRKGNPTNQFFYTMEIEDSQVNFKKEEEKLKSIKDLN